MSNNSSEFSLFKARTNVFRLQKRIFKSIFVGDITSAFRIQKILISSNSARFLAIRYVTYNKSNLLFQGLSLNFIDKFNLNQYLIENTYNWKPHKTANFSFLKNQYRNSYNFFEFWSVFDYSWQCLVKFAIEPAQEAIFSPRSFGFRSSDLFYEVQKIVFFNLDRQSFGLQKRVAIIKFEDFVEKFNYNQFFKKLLVPRFIKIGIFRFFKLGFRLRFGNNVKDFLFLNSLLMNVLLNGIENFSNCIRFGSSMLFFLRPDDNEMFLFNKIKQFLLFVGIDKV